MNDNSKAVLMFIFGAAVGVAVGYFLASDNKEEIISDIKDKVNKATDTLEDQIEKGKKLVGDLKKKATDLLEQADIG
ncbi:MAG: YtxH domain-containing protein [Chitinophagales bacterium]|nr:YtxH domain-containing protein [Bacteroidota bacterium]MBX7139733.1 YtxH domain-containing protein [Chitinophagales bacterium]